MHFSFFTLIFVAFAISGGFSADKEDEKKKLIDLYQPCENDKDCDPDNCSPEAPTVCVQHPILKTNQCYCPCPKDGVCTMFMELSTRCDIEGTTLNDVNRCMKDVEFTKTNKDKVKVCTCNLDVNKKAEVQKSKEDD